MNEHKDSKFLDTVLESRKLDQVAEMSFFSLFFERFAHVTEMSEDPNEEIEASVEFLEDKHIIHHGSVLAERLGNVLGPLKIAIVGVLTIRDVVYAIRGGSKEERQHYAKRAGLSALVTAGAIAVFVASISPIGIAAIAIVGSATLAYRAYRDNRYHRKTVKHYQENVRPVLKNNIQKTLQNLKSLDDTLVQISSLIDNAQSQDEQAQYKQQYDETFRDYAEQKESLIKQSKLIVRHEKMCESRDEAGTESGISMGMSLGFAAAALVGIFVPPVGLGMAMAVVGIFGAIFVGSLVKSGFNYLRKRYKQRTPELKKAVKKDQLGEHLEEVLGHELLEQLELNHNKIQPTSEQVINAYPRAQQAAAPDVEETPAVSVEHGEEARVTRKRARIYEDDAAGMQSNKRLRVTDSKKRAHTDEDHDDGMNNKKRQRVLDDDVPLASAVVNAMHAEEIPQAPIAAAHADPAPDALGEIHLDVAFEGRVAHTDLLFAKISEEKAPRKEASDEDGEGEVP